MSSKNLKKRANSESSNQSPEKKQKTEILKATVAPIKNEVSNSDGTVQVLSASQRKRLRTKNRKLAAIAKIKEAGGTPKSLSAGRKDKKAKKVDSDKNGEQDTGKKTVEKVIKTEDIEEKVKAKQEKRLSKKLKRQDRRQQEGQYKLEQVNLTADEIRLRITGIKERGELTKTAKRKLGVLIKKLAALEGTAVPVNNAADKIDKDAGEGDLSKSAKRRIRRKVKGGGGDNEEEEEEEKSDPGKEKLVNIQVFEKKKIQKQVAVKKVAQNNESKVNVTKLKEMNKQNQKNEKLTKANDKVAKKNTLKAESSDDDEEAEEEEDEVAEPEIDEEESEEDVDEEESEEDGGDEDEEEEEEETASELNSSQQEVEDEDDDEDEEEEEEEDEEEEEEQNGKVEIIQKSVKKAEGKEKKDQGKVQGVKKPFEQQQNSEKKKRYILFVGNIPYDAKPEDIKKHFLTKVGEVSSVRIPTEPKTERPRGFGYVEVTNDIDYEKGISLHHTFLNGRRINVEYTLSGSKTVNKRQELVSKNQKLHALRKAGKLAGSQKHEQKRSVRRFMNKTNQKSRDD